MGEHKTSFTGHRFKIAQIQSTNSPSGSTGAKVSNVFIDVHGILWNLWLVGVLEPWDFIFFPFSWECHNPNWLIFVQRGRSTTNQMKSFMKSILWIHWFSNFTGPTQSSLDIPLVYLGCWENSPFFIWFQAHRSKACNQGRDPGFLVCPKRDRKNVKNQSIYSDVHPSYHLSFRRKTLVITGKYVEVICYFCFAGYLRLSIAIDEVVFDIEVSNPWESPIAGWFLSWKIRSINGWLAAPLFQDTSI